MAHLSISQISLFNQCGEKYKRRYIDGIRGGLSVASVRGQAIHKSIERNNVEKMETGDGLSVDQMVEVALRYCENKFEREDFFSSDIDKTNTENELHEDFKACMPVIHEESKQIEPIESERMVEVNLPGIKRPLRAVFDCITRSGEVIDYKISSKSKPLSMAHESIQLTAYAYIQFLETGEIPELSIHNIAILKRQTKYNILKTKRNESDFDALLNRISFFEKSVELGMFPPAPRDSWACSNLYCENFNSCQYIVGQNAA